MGKRTRSQRQGSSPKNKVSSHRFPAANRLPRVNGEIAEVIETAGLSETIYASSSMEFAAEDGFKTDDGAWTLWNKAKDLYLWGE